MELEVWISVKVESNAGIMSDWCGFCNEFPISSRRRRRSILKGKWQTYKDLFLRRPSLLEYIMNLKLTMNCKDDLENSNNHIVFPAEWRWSLWTGPHTFAICCWVRAHRSRDVSCGWRNTRLRIWGEVLAGVGGELPAVHDTICRGPGRWCECQA